MAPKKSKTEPTRVADANAEKQKPSKGKAPARASADASAEPTEPSTKKQKTAKVKAVALKVPDGPILRTETPRAQSADGGVSIIHWNVGGLNGLLNKPERTRLLRRLVEVEQPAIISFSEHKLSEEKLDAATKALQGALPEYTAHWAVCTVKKGYSGVAALVRDGVAVHSVRSDDVGDLNEGRTLTLELEHVWVVSAYVPNSGQDLSRLEYRTKTWDAALAAHVASLEATGKPVVLIGDLNVAPLDADIWNFMAKHVPKSAGTTPQERASFARLIGAAKSDAAGDAAGGDAAEDAEPYATTLADAFRTLHPDATGVFSYWSTRAGSSPGGSNKGLRLDHALVSKSVVDGTAKVALHDCQILHGYAPKGDHCPILLGLKRA